MHEPLHEFRIPISMPVTLSPRYFGVSLYQSLQFIKNNISKISTKIDKTNTYNKIGDYKIDDMAVNKHKQQLDASHYKNIYIYTKSMHKQD